MKIKNQVTIVMYHYVRDLKHSSYPEIKGLDLRLFKKQLQYILKYYKVIRMQDLVAAVKSQKKLPRDSLLLTFDDGYKDHFERVFPILDASGIQGSFFPSAKAIEKHQVLDVNKIHFILAAVKDKEKIISDIYKLLGKFRKQYSLASNGYYYKKLAVKNRFDTPGVVFIKIMLQRELAEKLRNIIVNSLFDKYVSKNEMAFSRELYMGQDQLKRMKSKGMYIGSHGYNHYWLDAIGKEQQAREIELSLAFLKQLGADTKDWAFSYPYGAYNESLITLLKKYGCRAALTTQVGIADLNKENPLLLPRLDTNDLPKDNLAKANKWRLFEK
jgi:peptidoglycan/xylan/chitin deacetylase (PgdA/CDA1 family)